MSNFTIYNDKNVNNLSSNNVNSGSFSVLSASIGNINLLTLGNHKTVNLTSNLAGTYNTWGTHAYTPGGGASDGVDLDSIYGAGNYIFE